MKRLFSFFTKRADEPVESRDYGKLYFALSALLFVGTMWAVVDEISTRRPWKENQDQYLSLSQQKWQEKLNDARSSFDSASYLTLSSQLTAAEGKLNSTEVQQFLRDINALDESLLELNREFTFAKSRGDEAYYFWKKSIHDGAEDQGYKTNLDDCEKKMAAANSKIDAATSRRDSLQKIVDRYKNAVKEVRGKVKDLYASIDLATTKLEHARGASVQIKQVMMNNFDKTNFGTPKARIDRCQTCHLGWKDETMEEAAQPFTKHPEPELLKIHNPETFGCTPCHRGQGAALTAGLAHGNDDHYWEWPLLKGEEVYASCNGCHTSQSYLKYGGRFNKAKQMLEEAGCFGCHEIKGFTDLAKIGPEINQLGAKTNPEWVFRWVRNPKDYNPHTRMPNFRFSNQQAEAVSAYLWNVGKQASFQPRKGISVGGNPEHGKELVNTIGCKGCHVIGDDTRMREARGFSYDVAPELSRAGSKLDPDWMFEWIKNPRQYRPNTRMPNLRLTDQEAKDVVAYLKTMKDTRQVEQVKINLEDTALARKGDKLIREYGCAGCHQIKGMEREGKVSVSLSNFGRKRVDELDFGDTKIHHSWDEWFFGKLKDARQYTTERIISKMPVFGLVDSEIVTLRTLIRGMTKEGPEEQYRQPVDKIVQAMESGRRLTHYYNCINCHKIEELGGSVKAVLDDEAMAPPYLYPEGSKVQEPWLHSFLRGPAPIRPWLKIRMPTFSLTDDEVGTITRYFLALHKIDFEIRDYQAFAPDPATLPAGKKLFEGLQCLSCHYTGKIPEGKTPGDLAPNLAMAAGRLKPDWVLEWIARPDSIQPGTRMPNFYPDMQSPDPEILNGDAKVQIRALRDHVFTIGKMK
jgi:mono/diheme cytochrome c family protein